MPIFIRPEWVPGSGLPGEDSDETLLGRMRHGHFLARLDEAAFHRSKRAGALDRQPQAGPPMQYDLDALIEQLGRAARGQSLPGMGAGSVAALDAPSSAKRAEEQPPKRTVLESFGGDRAPQAAKVNLASQHDPFADPWLEEQKRRYRLERIVAGLRSGARMAILDATVGSSTWAAEKLFDEGGHHDAARLLREFRTGTGGYRRFDHNSPFTKGFVKSETTQYHIQNALKDWKGRRSGFQGQYREYKGTFQPVQPEFRFNLGAPAMVQPGLRLVGSPEAHVIGSFRLDGRIMSADRIEWKATSTMSLSSFFARNWHGLDVIDDNSDGQRYSNMVQDIVWTTDFEGKLVK